MIIYLLSKKAYQNNIVSLNESATDRYIDKLIYEYLPEQLKPYFNTKIGDLIKEDSKWITPLGLTQDMAKKYSNTELGDYLRINICQKFDIEGDTGPKKYKRGIFRIVITELGYLSQPDNNSIDSFKNDVMYIYKVSSTDSDASKLDSNFNGLSFKQIHSMFKDKRKSQFNQVRDNVMLDFRNNNVKSNYTVIPIHKQSECLQFSPYTSWCITNKNIGETNYNSYTDGGRRFYIFLRNDYKTVSEPKVVDELTPLDNYGLSMISFLVNAEGEISIITTRWNHDYDGEYKNPDEKTIKMFQTIIGMNLFEVCKPYSREELHRMGITPLDEVQELLDSGESLDDIFDHISEYYYTDGNKYYKVRLNNKYNYVTSDRKLLCDKWYYRVYDFNEGLAPVQREDEKYNFIDKNGKEILNTWYYDVCDFEEGFARVQREEYGKWNFIDKNGNEISKTWYYWVGEFKEGLACVEREEDGKWNFIDKNGNEILKIWYYYVFNFNKGFARVQREDGKWNFIDKNGKELLNTWYYWVDDFINGLARVQLDNGEWCIIDTEGNYV